jgi:TRAP-type mannitol/chloroaromatic compound transport system substrate-binding protein
MVTSWPANSVGFQTSAERLARSIGAMSGGHLKVTVYPADSLVRPFEVFDAVSAGAADMYHTAEVYFGKSPALNFFDAVPYGLTADELCSWINSGGGQALWDEVDAQFNIKPLDGSEYVGPWMDMDLGLDKAADYYYYPGFHQPGENFTLGVNKTLWDGLPASERALIETAAQAEVTRSLAQFNFENVKSLKLLRHENRIKILRFNDELIKTFGKLSKEVLADTAAKDPLARTVHDSYVSFRAGVMDWGELSETGYRDTRRLALE